ncbi:guanylate-binding protein 1-like [Antechinus flavipes]|uniref:guanylate-binding protein 1-like n=1 Tax=Antechinus flavipes TaxID=38775 RepID=UPI002235A0D2|nr:guanylate-binding protein 1-like [Antechinus flavipes]
MALPVCKEAPKCLMENNDGDLKVNPKAPQILTSIIKPIVVVVFAGQHSIGKSYLMDWLAGSNSVEEIKREAAEKDKLLKQQQVEKQQKIEAQQRSLEEKMNQLKWKMMENRYKRLEKNNMMLKSKLKEQEKLRKEDFQKEVAKMKKKIKGLEAENKDIKNKNSSWWGKLLGIAEFAVKFMFSGAGKFAEK